MRISTMALGMLPLIAGTVLGAARPAQPEPQCVVAQRWVEEHAGNLPKTLREISSQPVAIRKAIMAALPKITRLELWHEQFTYYASQPGLTAEQKAFLQDADAAVTAFTAARETSATVPGLDTFGQRAIALFGRERASLLFANIGIETIEERLPQSAVEPPGGNCTCKQGDGNWCGNAHIVRCLPPESVDEPECTTTESGCGWFFLQECNGKCYYGDWPSS